MVWRGFLVIGDPPGAVSRPCQFGRGDRCGAKTLVVAARRTCLPPKGAVGIPHRPKLRPGTLRTRAASSSWTTNRSIVGDG